VAAALHSRLRMSCIKMDSRDHFNTPRRWLETRKARDAIRQYVAEEKV
jgi:hypothetical protein